LQEAARFLSQINWETTAGFDNLDAKIAQLRLERNYGEAIHLLQTKLAHFPYVGNCGDYCESFDQVALALIQHLAGDSAGAKVTAEQASDSFEQLSRDESRAPRGRADLAMNLSQAYAVRGEKDSAIKLADRAIMLLPSAKDPLYGPNYEENLALIQTMVGENSHAISTLTQLLQTPYFGGLYGTPITPALLRLDPLWDPLRSDPAFQKLCEEKQPLATP
jgi:hypothetical protein